jgi:hypothetical protein
MLFPVPTHLLRLLTGVKLHQMRARHGTHLDRLVPVDGEVRKKVPEIANLLKVLLAKPGMELVESFALLDETE